MIYQIEKLLAQKPMKKPPNKWLNWWEALEPCHNPETGERKNPGDQYPALDHVYPSKEIAEQTALDTLRTLAREFKVRPWVKYIGAFPEGERP